MRRKDQRSVSKNLSVYDRSTYAISPPPQPFANGNQPLGIVHLFGCAGAAVHNSHGEWRHSSVEPGQLG
jgi:hypothetical protein